MASSSKGVPVPSYYESHSVMDEDFNPSLHILDQSERKLCGASNTTSSIAILAAAMNRHFIIIKCALASENRPYMYKVIIGIIDRKDKRQILAKILLLAILVI